MDVPDSKPYLNFLGHVSARGGFCCQVRSQCLVTCDRQGNLFRMSSFYPAPRLDHSDRFPKCQWAKADSLKGHPGQAKVRPSNCLDFVSVQHT